MSTDIEIGGHADIARKGHMGHAASGEGVTPALPEMASHNVPLAATISDLERLQKRRTFCIEMQSVMDRKTDSMLVYDVLGMPFDTPKGARKKWFGEAAKLRRSIEKHGGIEGHEKSAEGQSATALSAAVPLILAAGQFRAVFDQQREGFEAEMCRLAQSLPAHDWWCSIRGVAALGLAVVVAETRDLAGYPSPDRVCKRLGLAPKFAYPVSEDGIAMVPKARRGRIFGVITQPLFFAQKAGDPYRDAYDNRRLHTSKTHPEWTKGHSHKDALRYMTQRLLRNLWRAWR